MVWLICRQDSEETLVDTHHVCTGHCIVCRGHQSFAYIDVTHGGIYNRLSADYALNDQLHATLGYDFFHADRGMFTVYDKNSEVFLKLKYSF